MGAPLRVVICEDDPAEVGPLLDALVRAGYEPGWETVAGAGALRDRLAWGPRPDVVLAGDGPAAGGDVLPLLAEVRTTELPVPLVALGGGRGEGRVVEVLAAGADGYLLRPDFAGLGPTVARALAGGSERARTEAALRQSEHQYRELFGAARRQAQELTLLHRVRSALGRELDLEAVFRVVVEAVATQFGYSHVSLYLVEGTGPGASLELQHQVGYDRLPGRVPVGRGVMGRVARTGEPALVGAEDADPDVFWAAEGLASEVCVPLRDGGRIAGVLNVESGAEAPLWAADLGLMLALSEQVNTAIERARLYAEVRASETRYRGLVEQLPAVVYISLADPGSGAPGSPLYVSPRVRAVLGCAPEDWMLGAGVGSVAWAARVHPEDRARWAAAVADAAGGTGAGAGGGAGLAVEYRFATWDGREVWLRDEATPTREGEGAAPCWQGVLSDVTERRRVEEDLRQAKEAAEAANGAKTQFLSRMSHELRTPLNAILGFAQLMAMDALTPDQGESVDQILGAGRHLLGLINEVLDLARIEAGRMHLSLEPVPLADLVAESVDLVAALAARRRLTLRVDTAAAGRLCVQADRQRFKQVLLNLLSNAVKYTPPGGAVDVTCRRTPDGGLRTRVADTGPGIPEERLPRLFSPFDRLGAEETEVEGTGLGLALSLRIVEAMGSTIGVESEVGLGSAFWVDLPTAAPVDRPRVGTAPLGPVPVAPDASACLLYIEDNLPNFRLVERILAHRPEVRLLTAMQGELGIVLAREHRPDLILLDLHLPDLNGDAVLRRLRRDPLTARIPVVMVSADASARRIEDLLAAGARSYLTKPLDVGQFLRLVDECLSETLTTVT